MREIFNKTLGRWSVLVPGRGYVYRHRFVMEQHHGRQLAAEEHVHHINGDKTDDRIENLMIVTNAEHNEIHRAEREAAVRATWKYAWSKDYACCVECGTTEGKNMGRGLCGRCYFRLRSRRLRGGAPRKPATIVVITCEWCGADKPFTLHELGSPPRRFCDKACASASAATERWSRRYAGDETAIGKRKAA